MIIADLNYLEVVAEATVEGGTGRSGTRVRGSEYTQTDRVSVTFDTLNRFQTVIFGPFPVHTISAAAGAKGDAIVSPYHEVYSFTKADTLAVTDSFGNSFSSSASASLINW